MPDDSHARNFYARATASKRMTGLFRLIKQCFPAMALVAICACSPDYSPDTYATRAVQQANKVEQGVVVGVRRVAVSADGTTGAATGAAAGGVAGSQAPGGGLGSAFGAIGGALVGGLFGTAVEHVAGDTTAFEYIVRNSKGELLSVTQKDATPLSVGQRVLVIAGSQARIVPDYTAPPEPAPPPAPDPATAPAPVAPAPVSETTQPMTMDEPSAPAATVPEDSTGAPLSDPPAVPSSPQQSMEVPTRSPLPSATF